MLVTDVDNERQRQKKIILVTIIIEYQRGARAYLEPEHFLEHGIPFLLGLSCCFGLLDLIPQRGNLFTQLHLRLLLLRVRGRCGFLWQWLLFRHTRYNCV